MSCLAVIGSRLKIAPAHLCGVGIRSALLDRIPPFLNALDKF